MNHPCLDSARSTFPAHRSLLDIPDSTRAWLSGFSYRDYTSNKKHNSKSIATATSLQKCHCYLQRTRPYEPLKNNPTKFLNIETATTAKFRTKLENYWKLKFNIAKTNSIFFPLPLWIHRIWIVTKIKRGMEFSQTALNERNIFFGVGRRKIGGGKKQSDELRFSIVPFPLFFRILKNTTSRLIQNRKENIKKEKPGTEKI